MASPTSFVLTAIGDDRAGLVGALADVVTEHGGNWEQSQMAELAGKFAGIVLVTVPAARADELVTSLTSLAGVLEIHAHPGGEPVTDAQRFTLHLLGNDHPGIVRDLSHALTDHGLSIDQLATETREAPMAGGVLFEAEAVLEAPADLDVKALAAALEDLAGELMVDIDLEL
jgi:glycine cleavage system regulatory protein